MLTGRPYTLPEFIVWTRRTIYALVVLSIVPAILYRFAGFTWLTIPWSVLLLLGTTVSLSASFKMLQTYNRMQDAQQVWASIVGSSRSWGAMCRDLVADREHARGLVYRHLAWLAALRHQLRRVMAWESTDKPYNAEYRRRYRIQEREESLEAELARYVDPDDAAEILSSRSSALQALGLQSRETKRLLGEGALTPASFAELQKVLRELQDAQGRTERIKNFPYPRQHAFVNTLFVRILCVLLPFGVMGEFARLDGVVEGWAKGNMIWFGVPLSILISWMYASLDRVGESTENPFEGGANDVPITRICREIEGDLRGMLGEVEIPYVSTAEVDIAT
ncbi:MAG TPA: bestrophin family ion channel [Rhodanobacteraceae bacterium]|nr:bestrophin family ion channel [Rhodanobacteraceae bacterium]